MLGHLFIEEEQKSWNWVRKVSEKVSSSGYPIPCVIEPVPLFSKDLNIDC